jgi:hypothetical protein
MSHLVDFADTTVARLQRLDLTVPLVDNIETVVNKLADFYEQARSAQPQQTAMSAQSPPGPRQFNGASPPDLTHTKVLSVKIGGAPITDASWSGLLYETIRRAKGQITKDGASRLLLVNFVIGKKEVQGFRHLPEAGISVQGQNANYAWRGASHIAKELGIPIDVEFLWRADKEGAAHPGVAGRLTA